MRSMGALVALALCVMLPVMADGKEHGGKEHGGTAVSETKPPGLSKNNKTPAGLAKQEKIPKGRTKGEKTGWQKNKKPH